MAATLIGVRHHSPTCARLVASTIARLRPAYVLVEGPADFNDRVGELLLGHTPPIAIFSFHRADGHSSMSWTPLCDYSPEWQALTVGHGVGAEVRFIDLPAWHPALAGRVNRYADADLRCVEATASLRTALSSDNPDLIWDELFETGDGEPEEDLLTRLGCYFATLRGACAASGADAAREEYMARQVVASVTRAGDRPVVVVVGGFHQPALEQLVAGAMGEGASDPAWPEVPRPAERVLCGSYLVPYAFQRLDALGGYQSGMPSPGYYQRLWEKGPAAAAEGILRTVVTRLRECGQIVSTADLIAVRAMASGLARLRGHSSPARADVLDGLVSVLVNEAMEVRPPWTERGSISQGAHPAVLEMVNALSGDRVGRLDPLTPEPPLVADVASLVAQYRLEPVPGQPVRTLDLTEAMDLSGSQVLHRLRVLGIPGYQRLTGPEDGWKPTLGEQWRIGAQDNQLPALIEAGARGATLADAAAGRLEEMFQRAEGDPDRLSGALFDATLCGLDILTDRALDRLAGSLAAVGDLGGLGTVLTVTLSLWRRGRLWAADRNEALARVISDGVTRALWLAEGARGRAAPADPRRLAAVAAVRDVLRHAGEALGLDRAAAVAVMGRLAGDGTVPPDLRGAALGLLWSLAELRPGDDVASAVRGAAIPGQWGDWLAGLFCLAREEVSGRAPGAADPDCPAGGTVDVLGIVDDVLGAMAERDFLVGLPSLRQAFEFFPPRERDAIARSLLTRRGMGGSHPRALLRTGVDHVVLARARALEGHVTRLLAREGLRG